MSKKPTEKPPAFQFYAADFLVDENVTLMSNQAVGCYIKLMAYCWREGSIPSDVSKIAKLCCEKDEIMAELWLAISCCFIQSSSDAARLVHPRLIKELIKQKDHKTERSESGKKGAEARWGNRYDDIEQRNGSAIKEPLAKNASSSSSSSSLLNTLVISDAKDTIPCPHQEIIAIYHEVLPQCPQIRDWTPSRQSKLRARWNEEPRRQHLEYWRKLFEYIASCDFLVGKAGQRPFFANLEWIVTMKHFTDIRESKYANR